MQNVLNYNKNVNKNENQKKQEENEEGIPEEYREQLKRFEQEISSGILTQESLNDGTYRPIEQQLLTKESQISFELLNANGLEEIVDLYEQYDLEGDITADLSCMFLHFICSLKVDVTEVPVTKNMLSKILKNLDNIDPDNLRVFLWAVGSYNQHFSMNSQYNISIELPESSKQKISEILTQKYKQFQYGQVVPLSYACVNIFNSQQDQILLQTIIQKFSYYLSQNVEFLEIQEIIQFISIFQMALVKDKAIIEPFINKLHKGMAQLEPEDLTKIIQILEFCNNQDKMLVADFFNETLNRSEEFSLEDTCQVIYTVPTLFKAESEVLDQILGQLLKKVMSDYKQLDSFQYVNLWLTIAKLKIDKEKYERLLKVLKRAPEINKNLEVKKFEYGEIVQVIIACSALQINDKEFINLLIKDIKVEFMQKEDLFNLALSFIIYVKQYTTFYTEVHKHCCLKYEMFSDIEKKLLTKTFTRVKSLLPQNSPFIQY
ncbi:hypothetical protein PPERSA_05094 [Pseudocohnilembus persalinus]|uniref:Uncharacterized protein n=1 Tax=Pseudocohnilembus persalinus TaxID=266149 RepID=A0A0V0QWC8_PSEPJ|nr:hypothetical protein PPERSA_05094 [Pseudocohnilembus persalinus]|eukprot:KRX06481.1 hypothetical protein PPERSA_05094 [Pseudocohnilembus persalinus]